MADKNENTTIIVTKKTRDQLKEMGSKGESYDDIIFFQLLKNKRKKWYFQK